MENDTFGPIEVPADRLRVGVTISGHDLDDFVAVGIQDRDGFDERLGSRREQLLREVFEHGAFRMHAVPEQMHRPRHAKFATDLNSRQKRQPQRLRLFARDADASTKPGAVTSRVRTSRPGHRASQARARTSVPTGRRPAWSEPPSSSPGS